MLKLFALLLARLDGRLNLDADEVDRAFLEPLEHPAIRTMTIKEQADLPVDRSAYYEGRAPLFWANARSGAETADLIPMHDRLEPAGTAPTARRVHTESKDILRAG